MERFNEEDNDWLEPEYNKEEEIEKKLHGKDICFCSECTALREHLSREILGGVQQVFHFSGEKKGARKRRSSSKGVKVNDRRTNEGGT